jgi:hypothetical protein
VRKWEYLFFDLTLDGTYLNKQKIKWDWNKRPLQVAFSEFGEQGRELVAAWDHGGTHFIFKRPKP